MRESTGVASTGDAHYASGVASTDESISRTPEADHFSSFQFPVQHAIEDPYFQFSVLLLNIDATPDVDPEPPARRRS